MLNIRAYDDVTVLTKDYRYVYDDTPPLPGSSIGPVVPPKEPLMEPPVDRPWTGTLRGYLTHDGDYFALTNHHVVAGPEGVVIGSDPYL